MLTMYTNLLIHYYYLSENTYRRFVGRQFRIWWRNTRWWRILEQQIGRSLFGIQTSGLTIDNWQLLRGRRAIFWTSLDSIRMHICNGSFVVNCGRWGAIINRETEKYNWLRKIFHLIILASWVISRSSEMWFSGTQN